ncbi:MAG: hypothetical protein H7246_10025 [Phycisphaerae bacterium]|nr:hypothetical protein [Saprospiraceae bacterium]
MSRIEPSSSLDEQKIYHVNSQAIRWMRHSIDQPLPEMGTIRFFFQTFWIACCALSLMAQTRLLLGIPLTLGWLDGFVFGGTLFGYYCTHPNRWYRNVAWAAGFLGGICFLIPLVAAPEQIGAQLIVLTPVLFWLAYYGFQRPGNAGLRSRLLAKPLTIALTWAWVTVLLPTPFAEWPMLLFLLLGRAAFIFALALAYDLCDADYDLRHGLRTMTGALGFEKSIALIYKSLAFAGVCICVNLYFNIYDFPNGAGLAVSLGFSTWWLQYLLQKKDWESWQKPLIDGLMALQFLLVWLFSIQC